MNLSAVLEERAYRAKLKHFNKFKKKLQTTFLRFLTEDIPSKFTHLWKIRVYFRNCRKNKKISNVFGPLCATF